MSHFSCVFCQRSLLFPHPASSTAVSANAEIAQEDIGDSSGVGGNNSRCSVIISTDSLLNEMVRQCGTERDGAIERFNGNSVGIFGGIYRGNIKGRNSGIYGI